MESCLEGFIGAIGLVRREGDSGPNWLVRRDAQGNYCRCIQANRLEGESYREALGRELAWTLNLERKRDFIISSVPRAHFQAPLELIHGCGGLRCAVRSEGAAAVPPGVDPLSTEECPGVAWVIAQLFIVSLYGRRWNDLIAEDRANEWWTTGELRRGVSRQATPLDPVQRLLLERTEAISPDMA